MRKKVVLEGEHSWGKMWGCRGVWAASLEDREGVESVTIPGEVGRCCLGSGSKEFKQDSVHSLEAARA